MRAPVAVRSMVVMLTVDASSGHAHADVGPIVPGVVMKRVLHVRGERAISEQPIEQRLARPRYDLVAQA